MVISTVVVENNGFSLSRDLAGPRDLRFKHKVPVKVSHHLAKFAGHRYCGIGNIMVLDCHVILQDIVIKGSCDLIGRTPVR